MSVSTNAEALIDCSCFIAKALAVTHICVYIFLRDNNNAVL